VVVITSVALAQEVLDEKRFHKAISAPLAEVDNLGRGLFTSPHGDPEWAVARKSFHAQHMMASDRKTDCFHRPHSHADFWPTFDSGNV
jgi:hypothetical protein